jgi:hypothetical protein
MRARSANQSYHDLRADYQTERLLQSKILRGKPGPHGNARRRNGSISGPLGLLRNINPPVSMP